jgi:hypothetical protein
LPTTLPIRHLGGFFTAHLEPDFRFDQYMRSLIAQNEAQKLVAAIMAGRPPRESLAAPTPS